MANVHLICEGRRDGLDQRLLDRLVVRRVVRAVLVEPAGGDRGLEAVRRHFDRPPAGHAVSVQDRNYEPLARGESSWANPAPKKFLWRRHEIENYLLEPLVIHALFEGYRRASGAAWSMALPVTEAGVGDLLRALAVPLLPAHAANVAREELVRLINATGELKFAPRKPPAPAHWLASLQAEAARLVRACGDVAASPEFGPARIEARFQALLASFQRPDFLTSGEYTRDMAGKELLGGLHSRLRGLGAPKGLTREELEDQLAGAADRVYRPRATYAPDDFADLADVLMRL